jgi:hypothetical protein
VSDAPRAARIVAALQRLDSNADTAKISIHTDLIHAAMLDFLASRRALGHDIGSDHDSAYARPKSKTVGPARELRNLRGTCKAAIAGKITPQQWATAWAAMPERIKALWKPRLIETPEGRSIDRSTLAMGFETTGFAMIAPAPGIVLPVIEAKLASIKAMPNAKTRARKAEEIVAVAIIRAAYHEITGHKGTRSIRYGKLAGKAVELGRDIDAIFSTDLFAKDSTRLR